MDDGPSRSMRGGVVRPHQLMHDQMHDLLHDQKHNQLQSGAPDPGGER